MASDFQIDDVYSCLSASDFDTLGLLDPEASYSDYSQSLALGNGTEKGMGWAVAEWHWSAITATQRAVLRSLIPAKSATVFIRTQIQDGSFQDFQAIAIWPENENPPITAQGDFVITDFSIQFRQLIPQP